MKHIIAAIALFAATMPALAQAPLDRTQEYRMWSAEKMIERLMKYSRVPASHPALTGILDAAATGDDVLWAKVIDAVHDFEAGRSPLNAPRK